MRLSSKDNMEKNQENELENQRVQLLREAEQQREHELVKHTRIVQQLQTKLDAQQADIEMAGITEEQLRETTLKQEEMLKCAHDKLSTLEGVLPVDDNEELMTLRQTCNILKSEKDYLEMELKKVEDKLEQMSFLMDTKDQRVEAMTKEVEEERHQAISNFNALEKCRETVTDLQVQLDVARMETMGHEKKGNSLFAEVEDRRKQLEKKVISMKTKLDASQQQLTLKKQQLSKLKYQIAGLLEMGGGRADAAQLERLEQALNQRNGEIQILNSKIAQMEQKQNVSVDKHLDAFCKKFTGTGQQQSGGAQVDSDLMDLVKLKLKEANDKNEKLTAELKTERLQEMMSKDSLLRAERRLYQAESEADRLRAANIKLNLKLDELRSKYNIPDPEAVRQKAPQYYIEKIPLPTDEPEEKPTESSEPAETTAAAFDEALATVEPQVVVTAADDITQSSQTKSSPDAETVFDYSPAEIAASSSTSGLARDIQQQPFRDLLTVDGAIPKLRRTSKKSVSMNETVSTIATTGEVLEMTNLKTGDEKSSVLKRRTGDEEGDPENTGPEQGGGGKRKPKGRKCHNVTYMGSEPKNDCKQQ
ncbi:protein Spindly-B-like [Amphiura filiformis]|uniref:protein Spindly-B-like n=1 Tax=Amphiura filiformis TaxID=82378 RepID=UPI003B21CFCB